MAKGTKTGGRAKGTPNKATASIKEIAREYTEEAMEALVKVIRSAESDAARVSAIKELFDRGYGKASQSVEHSGGLTFDRVVREIIDPQGGAATQAGD